MSKCTTELGSWHLSFHGQRSSWGLLLSNGGNGWNPEESVSSFKVRALLQCAGNFEALWFYVFVSLAKDSRVPFFSFPPEVGTLQFANHLWTALCVVSVEPGHVHLCFADQVGSYVDLQEPVPSRACSLSCIAWSAPTWFMGRLQSP